MLTVRILADLPAAQQPKISVVDTGSASFRALLAYEHSEHPSYSVCDVELPAQVK